MKDFFENFEYELFERKPQYNLVKKLKNNNLKISVAESCTGGLICKMITDVPGASQVFEYGFCTYSNNSKNKILGIDKEFLYKYTAVSREIAIKMATSAKKISGADLSISVTGYAGSKKEAKYNKNVGLVFIGASFEEKNYVIKIDFKKTTKCTRKLVRELSAKHAISIAIKVLEDY